MSIFVNRWRCQHSYDHGALQTRHFQIARNLPRSAIWTRINRCTTI